MIEINRNTITGEIERMIKQRLPFSEDGVFRGKIKADAFYGGLFTTRAWPANQYNTPLDNYQILYKQMHTWNSGEQTLMAMGFVQAPDGTYNQPGIVLGAGDGYGNNRAFITKDTNSLNLFYVGNLSLGEVAGLAIYKDKIETTVQGITFNKNLANEFLVDATNWNKKLEEFSAKLILEDPTKGWNIPKENLKDSDVTYWNSGGAEGGLALTYYNLMNTDLGKTAPLPTSISMGNHGIRATATGGGSYAQLDYRGLYVYNGAVQIQNGSGNTVLNSNGIYADYIIGGTLSTYNFSGGGNYYIEMSKQLMYYKENSLIKMAQGFLPDHTGTNVPITIYGAGAGNDTSTNKGYITKTADAFNFYYISSANAAQGISIKADGIYCTSELKLNTKLSTTYLADGTTFVNKLQKLNTSGNFGQNQSGKRIELSDTLISKNSSGQNMGLYVDPTFSDLLLYYNGTLTWNLYQDVTSTSIRYGNSLSHIIDTGNTYCYNAWNFSNATVTGLQVVWG